MRIWAKTTLGGHKDAERLCRAFFNEFNPKNSIIIKNKEAKIEIFFTDEPPKEIIEAISQCEGFELHYGRELGEYEEAETKQNVTGVIPEQTEQDVTAEETSEQTEQDITAEETSEQTEQNVTAEGIPEQTEQDVTAEETSEQTEQDITAEETSEQTEQDVTAEETSEHTKPVAEDDETSGQNENSQQIHQSKSKRGSISTKKAHSVPQLEEIAKNAKSFEHFVKLVAEWLEMDKRQEFFVSLVTAATEVNVMSWKEVEKTLKSKSILYRSWDKIWVSQQISAKLNEYSLTLLL